MATFLEVLSNAWEKEHIPEIKNKDNCSGFVKDVLIDHGIVSKDNEVFAKLDANGLIEYFKNSSLFKSLGKGQDALKKAYEQAQNGHIVILGKKATGHGHVAFVMPGRCRKQEDSSLNPCIYGGAQNSSAISAGKLSLSQVIRREQHLEIEYFLVLQ